MSKGFSSDSNFKTRKKNWNSSKNRSEHQYPDRIKKAVADLIIACAESDQQVLTLAKFPNTYPEDINNEVKPMALISCICIPQQTGIACLAAIGKTLGLSDYEIYESCKKIIESHAKNHPDSEIEVNE